MNLSDTLHFQPLRVLVACESSRAVASQFEALGHYALSCDLLPADRPGNHHQGDVFEVIGDGWDIMIAHPPCTYLSSSGLHWNKNPKSIRFGGRQTEEALVFAKRLMDADIEHIAVENPQGCIGTRIRPADQYIQPHQFGHDASKKTGLWLKNLPKLEIDPAWRCPGRIVTYNGKTVERWANQTDSGQNRLGPSEDRWKIRSETYANIGREMARQWAAHVLAAKALKAAAQTHIHA